MGNEIRQGEKRFSLQNRLRNFSRRVKIPTMEKSTTKENTLEIENIINQIVEACRRPSKLRSRYFEEPRQTVSLDTGREASSGEATIRLKD